MKNVISFIKLAIVGLITFYVLYECDRTSNERDKPTSTYKEDYALEIDLETRKKIFYELATEEDKIHKTADEMFSPENFENHAIFTQMKFKELRNSLIKKYNITDSEYGKIMYEGVKKDWPFESSY